MRLCKLTGAKKHVFSHWWSKYKENLVLSQILPIVVVKSKVRWPTGVVVYLFNIIMNNNAIIDRNRNIYSNNKMYREWFCSSFVTSPQTKHLQVNLDLTDGITTKTSRYNVRHVLIHVGRVDGCAWGRITVQMSHGSNSWSDLLIIGL